MGTGTYGGQKIDIDLIDLSKSVREGANDGYKYIALLQDRFSRKMQARPLRGKTPEEVTAAYESMLDEGCIVGTGPTTPKRSRRIPRVHS